VEGRELEPRSGGYSTLERPSILDYWPGHLVAGSHKLVHRSTPIEPIAAGVPAHGGDTERIEAAQEGAHGGILGPACASRGRRRRSSHRRAAHWRNRAGRRQSSSRRGRPERRHARSRPLRSPAERDAGVETTPIVPPRSSSSTRIAEHDAEAGRFVTFAHSRRARDTIAAVRRMAASGSRTCQPARPASRTTLLSAGSSPSQYLVGCAGVQPARARMQRANGIGARRS
jgi:hypothetical protein